MAISAQRIYIVSTPASWRVVQERGELRTPAFETEGFIHAATAEQVPDVLARHFAGQEDLLLLEIDPLAIADFLRYELSPASGDTYPHIYAPVPVSAVLSVQPIAANR